MKKFPHLVCFDENDGEGWTGSFSIVRLTDEALERLESGDKPRHLTEQDYVVVMSDGDIPKEDKR